MRKTKFISIKFLFQMIVLPVFMAAQSPEPATLSFTFDKTELNQVLNQITRDYQLPILYVADQLTGIRVTAQCRQCSLEQALDNLLKTTPCRWKKIGDQIIITREKEPSGKPQSKTERNSIQGFIRNAENGETLSYVNILLEGTALGCASDENGYYVIPSVPDGRYTIVVRMMGYHLQKAELSVFNGLKLFRDFYLDEAVIQMNGIVKTALRERFERQIELSQIQLSLRDMNAMPSFVESDLFRSLQMLPGVTSQSDFSSALYIRGGNPSENLILLDDVRIYNPYHLGGLFSTFNTDAIKEVDISLGGFPARYGNANSSIISITNKDGNSREWQTRGSISLLSSKIMTEGPVPGGSFLISARRTYFDAIYNQFIRPRTDNPDMKIPYYFYDFHGKLNLQISPKNKLTLSGFYGDDIVYYKKTGTETDPLTGQKKEIIKSLSDLKFGNFTSTLKWQTIFSPQLFAEFIAAKSRFRIHLVNNLDEDRAYATDSIEDLTAKGDLTYFTGRNHEIKFGFEAQQLKFKINLEIQQQSLVNYDRKARLISVYLQDDWQITPLLNLQSGFRISNYSLGDYTRCDPRFSLRYRPKENLNLKGSVGLYHQYFYTFNPEDIDFLNYVRLIDLWFPIDDRYPPIRAVQTIVGIEYLTDRNISFSAEAYYKDYDHLLDLNEMGGQDREDDFLSGWGHVAGLELMARKERGRISGWISYTLSRAERTIELPRSTSFLKSGLAPKTYITYAPSHDRRHALSFVANSRLGTRWHLGTRITCSSGLPHTPTVGKQKHFIMLNDRDLVFSDYRYVKEGKNSQRLPAYFRWDISLKRTYAFKSWTMEPYLQINNVTNHHNLMFYVYDLETSAENIGSSTRATRQGIPMFPFFPSIGVDFSF